MHQIRLVPNFINISIHVINKKQAQRKQNQRQIPDSYHMAEKSLIIEPNCTLVWEIW